VEETDLPQIGATPMNKITSLIKNIPGKGFDWKGFYTALLGLYIDSCRIHNKTPLELTAFKAAKGVREMREAAYCLVGCIVANASTKSTFIPASDDTLSDGGFLGSNVEVTQDITCVEGEIRVIETLTHVFFE
jgi:hypothetical protein